MSDRMVIDIPFSPFDEKGHILSNRMTIEYNRITAEECLHKQLRSGHHRTQDNVELGRWFFVIIVIERITMITDNKIRWDFIGLSTDSKPTPATSNKVTDGSTFYEADTSKLYFWTKNQWYEKTSNVMTNIERKMKW